ncbi:MAG: hypothetical protein IJI47_06400 [Eubacterium sp.]|nr:hypothetical protein [Eubacterium sp.]
MNKSEVVTFDYLPKNVAELQPLAEQCFGSPFKMAALSVAVMMNYEADKGTTVEMINYLRGPRPLSPFDIQFLRDRLGGKMYVVRSYFNGTSVENDYTIPPAPFAIEVSDNPYSYQNEDYATLYLHSSGADNPRPVTLRLKPSTGQWFLWEHTFLADIRQPQSQNPWA